MIRLRDIMTREVVTLSPELTIRDAMSLLSSRHISGAPVVNGADIVGVITSTDLMAFAADLPGSPAEHLDPVGHSQLTGREEEFSGGEIEPTGAFFTRLWDDAGADVGVRSGGATSAEWSSLDEHTVEEAMTRAPIYSLPDDATLPAAAEYMRIHGIHRVLVTVEGTCVGIVTPTDIANAVGAHRLVDPQYVFGKPAHFPDAPNATRSRSTVLGERLRRSDEAAGRERPAS